MDTPALAGALGVLAANGVAATLAVGDEDSPAPLVSQAILAHNRGRRTGLAEGILITASHHPPHDGGFGYIAPTSGPAETANRRPRPSAPEGRDSGRDDQPGLDPPGSTGVRDARFSATRAARGSPGRPVLNIAVGPVRVPSLHAVVGPSRETAVWQEGREMLRNVTDLRGCAIRATDGVIGRVDDLYFDDEDWAIRYLVVDTGGWLTGRRVLISPIAIGHPDGLDQRLPVSLTKAQVENSPDIDTQKPVSRQQEAAHLGYYGYPYYWGGGGLWGMGAYPGGLTLEGQIEADMKSRGTRAASPSDDCHLRSCHAVIGHHIHATDGDIGHVEDFLVDEQTWAIRYLIVGTSHSWWGGHRVSSRPRGSRTSSGRTRKSSST